MQASSRKANQINPAKRFPRKRRKISSNVPECTKKGVGGVIRVRIKRNKGIVDIPKPKQVKSSSTPRPDQTKPNQTKPNQNRMKSEIGIRIGKCTTRSTHRP